MSLQILRRMRSELARLTQAVGRLAPTWTLPCSQEECGDATIKMASDSDAEATQEFYGRHTFAWAPRRAQEFSGVTRSISHSSESDG